MQAKDVGGTGSSQPGPAVRLLRRDPRSASPPGAMSPCGMQDGRSTGATAIKEDPVCMQWRTFCVQPLDLSRYLPGCLAGAGRLGKTL
jgi:hypothetical protein